MLWVVLYVQLVVQVLSEAPPAPPQNVSVDKWLLTWTPTTQEKDVTYTVQYRSFDSSEWKDIPACTQISRDSCNVASAKANGEFGCVKLRVRAERRLLTSSPAEACSRHGDACTPEVSLTARPGSLTVHLYRNHSLAQEYGNHALHRVYYGKEGESLEQNLEDTSSSVSLHELQKGQRYCTKVQYIVFSTPVGLPSCTQCELIPRTDPKQTEVVVAVLAVLFLVTLIPVIGYFLICQRGRIKQWLRPYEISIDFILEPFPEQYSPISNSSPSEEHCDVITCITPEGFRP